MNGVDVAKMRLLKTTPGDYLWASPDSALGVGSVWSVPLVISPSIAANNWLVGAFQQRARCCSTGSFSRSKSPTRTKTIS